MKFLVCILFLGLAAAGIVEVEDCGSSAEIVSLEFDGCDEKPCSVYHGTHATGRINLKANSPTNTLTCKLAGVVGVIELPFNGCPSDACASMTSGDCPVEAGETLVYELDFEILDLYPTIEVTAKWRLLDDNGDDFMCFLLPIVIKD
ncbi:epididymal secretory protein E1 [Eurytemora carolleeae]|uniref:epididymal secretory protein E1 n=1 Tax=Eurytemora carolleeae TaxID=1294199 RepID=UPI000C783FB4|nr:epididymal secretory protein E1 [Eurytemora carolleeae]|eukprot:XP_023342721.1 epididymal secretory protein E1-like [Eurytemora affinis]